MKKKMVIKVIENKICDDFETTTPEISLAHIQADCKRSLLSSRALISLRQRVGGFLKKITVPGIRYYETILEQFI